MVEEVEGIEGNCPSIGHSEVYGMVWKMAEVNVDAAGWLRYQFALDSCRYMRQKDLVALLQLLPLLLLLMVALEAWKTKLRGSRQDVQSSSPPSTINTYILQSSRPKTSEATAYLPDLINLLVISQHPSSPNDPLTICPWRPYTSLCDLTLDFCDSICLRNLNDKGMGIRWKLDPQFHDGHE